MRSIIFGSLVVWGLLGVTALGQTPQMTQVVVGGGTTINAGQRVTVEIFAGDVILPERVKAYQVQLAVVPLAGSTGTMALAGPDPAASLFVDETRADWAFNGQSSLSSSNEGNLRTAATLFSGSGANLTNTKYLSTYIFEAPLDAIGDFQINFVRIDPVTLVNATHLLDGNGLILQSLLIPADGTLTVTVLPPALEPPNNDCADAFVAFDGTTAFTTENGTTDGVDLNASCDEGSGVAVNQDIWYEYVASCTGVLTVSTCDDADFDTRIGLYTTGTATCACPTDNSTLVGCSDNGAGCAAGTSEVSMDVTAGSCFTIRIGGSGLEEGLGNISISCTPDLCDNALSVTSNSTVSGTTANTTVNDAPGLDCGTGIVDSPGVWYSVIGTGDLMTASLCGAASYDSRLSVFEGTCLGLSCVGDANDTCGSQESFTWCSTVGVEYRILVHGSAGASGDFTMTVSSQSCSDGDACTDDACAAGVCTHQTNFNAVVDCCSPSTGTLTAIDDGNPCTTDSCNAASGVVAHPAIPDGPEAACSDLTPCTIDACASGVCTNTDVNSLTCQLDSDCVGDATCAPNGFCECIGATLEMVASPGAAVLVPGCHSAGATIRVAVELGPGGAGFIVPADRAIVGAQFFISYDAATMSLLSVDPGSVLGTGSPFTTPIFEQVDPAAGTIDYGVAVSFGGSGTRVPGTVAVLTFQAIAECTADVLFRNTGPNGIPNFLTTIDGGELEPGLIDLDTLNIDATAPTLSACPGNVSVSADPGVFSATVSWPTPIASDSCDTEAIVVQCSPSSGSVFFGGTTPVTCTASDSCGMQDTCAFSVSVQPSTLTVDVELSPTMTAGPFERCITFDLFDCDAPAGSQRASVQQTLVFVGGRATGVQFQIPGGAWECVSARDELHTLRSTDAGITTVDGFNFVANFVGNPAAGGHWLLGGNLNDDDFIDIRDFGIFFPFFLTVDTPDTACGVSGPHADFNGDSVIDLLDLIFVSGNSLRTSEAPCCSAGGAAAVSGPTMSISVAQLRRDKQYGLIRADVNRDGVLDIKDMIAVITGEVPPTPKSPSIRGSVPVKGGRGGVGRTDHRK